MAEVAVRRAEARPREPDAWAQPETPARAGTFEWDPITEELRWSATCKAAFGSPADEEPTDEVFRSRLHPEDRSAVLERVERALDPSGPGLYRSRHRVLWPDGRVRWMRAKGSVAFGEVAGRRRAVHFAGTVLDVSEDRGAEGTLADRQAA
jgi:PAS domain S-box-containing protein